MNTRNLIVLILLVLFWGGPAVLAFYTDWLWFQDLGFAGVFRTRFLAQASLFVLGGLASVGAILGSAFLARRLAEQAVGSIEMPASAQMRAMERPFSLAVVGGGLFLALNMAGAAAGRWEHVLRWRHATPFGAADPQFGLDIGFFVFTLPVYRFVQGWLLTVTVLALAAAVAVYAFRIVFPQMPVSLEGETALMPSAPLNLIISRPMRRHLFGLGAVLLLLMAWGHWLAVYDLVYSPRGAAFGASYADIFARLPALRLQAVVALVGAGLVGAAAFRQGYRLAVAGAGLWIGAGILAVGVYPALVDRFVVQPQELERERPYIDAAILAGASRRHVIMRHLVPATAPQALIAVVLLLPHAVWHESTLSFLGFGLPPHKPSLGTLLEEARSSLLLGGWWTLAFPAAVLVIATVAVAVAGSALRSMLTPPRPSELRL